MYAPKFGSAFNNIFYRKAFGYSKGFSVSNAVIISFGLLVGRAHFSPMQSLKLLAGVAWFAIGSFEFG